MLDERFDEALADHRLLVVDEHPAVAHGLALALKERGWATTAIWNSEVDDIVAVARDVAPQVVLMDIRRSDGRDWNLDAVGPIALAAADVVMWTSERRRLALAEGVEAGAIGWIHRSAPLDDVDARLRSVLNGEPLLGATDRAALMADLGAERRRLRESASLFDDLTDRELSVLAALVEGLSAEEIARAHFVALTTVRSQIRGVLRKLGVRSQLAAVAIASGRRDELPMSVSPAEHRSRRFTDRPTPARREAMDEAIA